MLTDNEIERMAAEYIAADWTPDRYYRDMNLVAFARAIEARAALAVQAQPASGVAPSEIVVTKSAAGQIIAVTRQDAEGRILEVIAESATCGVALPVGLQWTQTIGGAWEAGPYLVAERVDDRGWNIVAYHRDPGMADDERRSEVILIAGALEQCKAACEEHARGVRAPGRPADATPEEWAAAVRLTFATARQTSSLQAIPSHWLDAMRDSALGVSAGAPGATDAERAAWLADKIVAGGDYAKEAAAMLRRWPAGVQPFEGASND